MVSLNWTIYQMTDSILLRKFTLFSTLPTEIRRTIWILATLEPRVIEIHKVLGWIDVVQYFSTTPMPSLLGICHESREEALKTYVVMEVSPTFSGPGKTTCRDAAKLFRDTFDHGALHPELAMVNCQMCAKRAQQQAYVKYIQDRDLRLQAEAQRMSGFGIFDFDGYPGTLEDVSLPDILLDTNGKY